MTPECYRLKKKYRSGVLRELSGFLFALLLFFLPLPGLSEPSFLITAPEEGVSGYQSNPLTVTAPEAGIVRIEVRDETTLFRVLEKEVPEGKSQILWDGLGWNEERMPRKQYTLHGSLTGVSGKVWTARTVIQLLAAQQAVLFALPSDPEVYLEDAADWFMEYKFLYTDQMVAEFFEAESETLVLKTSRQMKGGRVNQISYHLLTTKHRLAPGSYRVRIFGQMHPASFKEFFLTVHEGDRTELPVRVTGNIMPSREDSDEEIWAKMMAPSVVVDIADTAHQKVFATPDSSGRILGNLHGQSQALSVMEIQENWARIQAWNHENGGFMEGWVPLKKLKVVRPQTEYGLLVDKQKQTLTLYQNGKKIDTLLVSTGRMSKGELYQETAAGSFLTGYHMSDYSTNGLKYDFVIRYDGGNLLHQIPYSWSESGKKDMNPGELYLGTKASHACIRVQETPSEKGINAYWFWTHLPYHTRIIVLDDPVERERLESILTETTPELETGIGSAWTVEPEAEDEPFITLTFGGDVALGVRESYYGDREGLAEYLERNGMEWPFAGLQSVFLNDDLTVVNLECVLQDSAAGEDTSKQWRFRGLTSWTAALKEGGIDLVNLANNHTIDYGESGYESTLRALDGVVPSCGNRRNIVLEIKGVRFGFGGCRETTYKDNPGIIGEDIAELKEAGADFVVYQCHWGTEYDVHHNVLQESMARACQRAGADLVIGHHPHVVQGIDWIGDMPVIYSLGNLMFGGTIRLSTYEGMLARIRYYPEREKDRVEIRLMPVFTSSSSEKRVNDYQPRLALNEDAIRILRIVQKDTGFLLTEKVKLNY